VSPAGAIELLIIEDTLTQAMMMKHLLEGHGFVISIARSGADALSKLETLKPEAILTDINMPEMDGYQLARKLKESPGLADIPVILLASFLSPQDVLKIIDCKADNFILKCYDEDYFVPLLNNILKSANLRKKNGKQSSTAEVCFQGKMTEVVFEQHHAIDMLLSSFETNVYLNRKGAKADS
jgi:CheY-like chemotaxis protein